MATHLITLDLFALIVQRKVTCYVAPCYAVFPSLFYIIYSMPLHAQTPSVCEK